MVSIHELYVREYYKKLIDHITETIAVDKEDIDLINCLNDLIDEETTYYFLSGVLNIIDKVQVKYEITEDILDCIFDIYFKYMFDDDLVLNKSESMSYKQYIILEECKWVLKPSNANWYRDTKQSFNV